MNAYERKFRTGHCAMAGAFRLAVPECYSATPWLAASAVAMPGF
jgi:hypothetical protein